MISKVAQTRTKKGTGEYDAFAKWTTKECSTYLQYKKRPDDAEMPSLVKDLRSRCRSIMERKSPSVSPHASDDVGDAPGADDPGDGGHNDNDNDKPPISFFLHRLIVYKLS